MGFWSLVLLEMILLLAAGLVIFGGVKGILVTMLILSIMNYFAGHSEQFWRRENHLMIGFVFGILILLILGWQARRGSRIHGLAAGKAGMVLLGVFVTPVIALIIWALIFGTGLLKRGRKSEVLWGVAPPVWRLLLALAAVWYGNVLL